MALLFSNKMLYCLCLFKTTLSSSIWMAFLALFLLIFSSYLLLGFCFLSILYTSTAMVFSTVIFNFASKHKAVLHVDNNDDDKLVEENVLSYYVEESSDQQENLCKLERVIPPEAKEKGQEEDDAHAPSPDLLSESESEVDYSDGSISDEESLIEIALPSGHYVDPQKYDSNYYYKCSLQQQKRELSGEALFSQQSLMELLSEFNEVMSEEENLIEIDISMGSIKYSRLEIKA